MSECRMLIDRLAVVQAFLALEVEMGRSREELDAFRSFDGSASSRVRDSSWTDRAQEQDRGEVVLPRRRAKHELPVKAREHSFGKIAAEEQRPSP
jgi:hypothetical protein